MTTKKETSKKVSTKKVEKKEATSKVAVKTKVVKKAAKIELKSPETKIIETLKADKLTKTGNLLTVTIKGKVKMLQVSNKTEEKQIKDAFQAYYKEKTAQNQRKLVKLLETPVAKKEILKKTGTKIKEIRQEKKVLQKEIEIEKVRKKLFKDFADELEEKITSNEFNVDNVTDDEVTDLKKQLEKLQSALKKLEKVPDYTSIVVPLPNESHEAYRERMKDNNVPSQYWKY